jgi:hypothetical protein
LRVYSYKKIKFIFSFLFCICLSLFLCYIYFCCLVLEFMFCIVVVVSHGCYNLALVLLHCMDVIVWSWVIQLCIGVVASHWVLLHCTLVLLFCGGGAPLHWCCCFARWCCYYTLVLHLRIGAHFVLVMFRALVVWLCIGVAISIGVVTLH